MSRLYAEDSPILAELDELGIEAGQLQPAFVRFAAYPDVDEWPAPEIELPDLGPILQQIEEYAARHGATGADLPARSRQRQADGCLRADSAAGAADQPGATQRT